MRNKKLIIVAFTLLAILLLLLLYVFFKDRPEAPITEQNTPAPFEPFGTGAPSGRFETGLESELTTATSSPAKLPRLRRLSEEPVAGFTIVPLAKREGEEEAGLAARFVDRATGHIFETRIDAVSPIAVLSGTTIPQVSEAVFGSAEMLSISFINQDEGVPSYFLARLVPSATSTEFEDEAETAPAMLDGRFLPQTTKWMIFNADGSEFAYITANSAGSGLFSYNFKTQKVTSLFSSPLRELMPAYFGNDVLLTTLPSYGINGQSLRISGETGMRFLFANVPTLMVEPRPEGEELLGLRFNDGGGAGLFLRSRTGSSEEKDTLLPFVTLPEKCTWRYGFTGQIICAVPQSFPKGLPDSWLKGSYVFTDRIISFNANEYTTRSLLDPAQEVQTPMDIIKMLPSQDGRFLLFVNKTDGALWALDMRS